MKLKEINFYNIAEKEAIVFLNIRQNNKTIAYGYIGDVLTQLPLVYAEANIKSARWWCEVYVIEIEDNWKPPTNPSIDFIIRHINTIDFWTNITIIVGILLIVFIFILHFI